MTQCPTLAQRVSLSTHFVRRAAGGGGGEDRKAESERKTIREYKKVQPLK